MKNEPEITEEKLNRLLSCLVDTFKSKYKSNSHRLPECRFYLTDRMNCAKYAGLNYEYLSSNRDGDVVKVYSSAYVGAVKELEHRGYVLVNRDELFFTITEAGYKYFETEELQPLTPWSRMLMLVNKNQGLIGIVAIVVTIVIAIWS